MNKKFIKFTSLVAIFFSLLLLTSHHGVTLVKAASGQAVLLLGIDSGDLGRDEKGRSDVMMLLTIDGEGSKMTLTSIPRDSLVEIPDRGEDKINHAYAYGGPELSVATVENLLDIEIDNYIAVNMEGIKEVVNAVDGITVTPPKSFSIGDYQFNAGESTWIDGEGALLYAMERDTSGGDYGRQERQREIVNSVIDKALSFDGVKNAWALYKSGSQNIETDYSMFGLANLGRKYGFFDGVIETHQLKGEGERIDGIYYEIINEDSLQEIKEMLNEQLN